MIVQEVAEHETTSPLSDVTVVVCGSYRRDPEGLRRDVVALGTRFAVISPKSLDFVDPTAAFVRLPWELDESESAIEERHLTAMRDADLVWFHAPGGYVGSSGAMELGHAAALGIPVFATELPMDAVLAANVTHVSGPSEIHLDLIERSGRPGSGVDRLQRYYRRTAERRGWGSESARDTMLLLTEELGELARAVRKLDGLARHRVGDAAPDAAGELADVQLYLVHLANTLGLELSEAVTAKERVNAKRFERSRDAA